MTTKNLMDKTFFPFRMIVVHDINRIEYLSIYPKYEHTRDAIAENFVGKPLVNRRGGDFVSIQFKVKRRQPLMKMPVDTDNFDTKFCEEDFQMFHINEVAMEIFSA
eukprot:CAMPEP_0116556176 /NCGR_PEP_ID=MMETSP0397-20121206/8546_1 /TAXON_ID=216820 /ORGANISM="Cyclophora tenuis, Strain ECT3854" /LENGTH=105 /DNA_ID=CAMNT_0004081507 /DNA_START=790 /DNA_END=1103 /DNA_ORIENTATION=+